MATTLPPVGFLALQIGGTIYFLPENSTSPSWGEELSSLIEALVAEVNGLVSPFDILNRLTILTTAPTAFTDLPNITLDPAVVNGGILTYSARYTTSSITASEVGEAFITYVSSNPVSAKFDIAKSNGAGAGILFYVTDQGQLQTSLTGSVAGTGFNMRLRMTLKAFEL